MVLRLQVHRREHGALTIIPPAWRQTLRCVVITAQCMLPLHAALLSRRHSGSSVLQVNFVVMNKVGGMLQRVDYVRKVRLPKLSLLSLAWMSDVPMHLSHPLLLVSCCRCMMFCAYCILPVLCSTALRSCAS